MKLYAKIQASRGGREAVKGDDDVITVSLFVGNKMQGILTLNSYNNELVYSTLGNNEFIPVYREQLKGKTQKGVSSM